MAISNAEIAQLLALTGRGKPPLTGGPAGTLKSVIAETMAFDSCASNPLGPGSGVMQLTAIWLAQGQVITSINFVSGSTAESGGSHLWFALYDDGRASTTAGQLACLGQTPDQTGAAAFAANTSLGLSLNIPYTTTYSGIYYVGFMCSGTTPTLAGFTWGTQFHFTTGSLGTFIGANAGSALTTTAPNPSGALSFRGTTAYAYVS